jgi:hypothetical protein
MKNLAKILFILASLCVISLPSYLFLFGKKETKAIALKTLVQKTSFSSPISPRFFSDYLHLCPKGKSLEISKLDEKKIEKKLREFPIFQKVQAHISSRGELEVAYDLKKPHFLLLDFSNLAIDPNGYVFPLKPFFSPKKLTQVYLGISQVDWNHKNNVESALKIQSLLDENLQELVDIETIDLSGLKVQATSLKHIVVTISYKNTKHYLRLSQEGLEKGVLCYISLFKENNLNEFLQSNLIFDARFKKFATLKMVE